MASNLAEVMKAIPDFAELVEVHQAMVFSLAYHFLRDRVAAEEIAQDVFVELHRRLGQLDSAEHVVFWLRRVTANRCIDAARQSKRRPEVPLDSMPDSAVSLAQTDLWLSERLRRLVASLPEKARIVVLLRYQEDLDPLEISKLLDMPVNTVKSHLQRALVLLRQKAGTVERKAR